MKFLKCEMCGGGIAISVNTAFGTCGYCDTQVLLEQISPQAVIAEVPDNDYKLILLDAGSDKDAVIQEICDAGMGDIGIAEATEAIEKTPALILSFPDAELIALTEMSMELVGATVQILKPGEPINVNYIANHTKYVIQ
jgi:ribosomal protein L7/L12